MVQIYRDKKQFKEHNCYRNTLREKSSKTRHKKEQLTQKQEAHLKRGLRQYVIEETE